MKTSTFLTKVLKSFHDGKSYTNYPNGYVTNNANSPKYWKTRSADGKNNLIGAITKIADETGFKKSVAQMAIAKSLGHPNLIGFQTKGFSKVKAVVKAAIKRERASGN